MFAPFGIVVAMGPSHSGHERTVADFSPEAVYTTPLTAADMMRISARLRAGLNAAVVTSDPAPAALAGLAETASRFNVAVSVVRTLLPIAPFLRSGGHRADWNAHVAVPDSAFVDMGLTVIDADRFGGMVPLDGDGRHLAGGFDIIGDVHGELETLWALLAELGYDEQLAHPKGRIVVFVGDLVDKGDRSLDVLRLVRSAHAAGRALAVRGNHEDRLAKVLLGVLKSRNRRAALDGVLAAAKPDMVPTLVAIRDAGCVESGEAAELVRFLRQLPIRLELDSGRLVVVHAAEPPGGPVDAETELRWTCYGPPRAERHVDWRSSRRDYTLVHGHESVPYAREAGGIVDLDTGCGSGGPLSCYSWPQRKLVSVGVPALI